MNRQTIWMRKPSVGSNSIYKDLKAPMIAVTHDRYFLDNVAGWILELDRGEGIPYQGNYSSWLEQKQARLAVEQKGEDKNVRKHLNANLNGSECRQRVGMRSLKPIINDYEKLVSETHEKSIKRWNSKIPAGDRLGEIVVEAHGVSKAYDDKLLFENLEFSLPRGRSVGVIGPNGAGKTTLFRLITEQEKADSGDFRVGDTVKLGYVDQSRDSLDANKTLFDEISDGLDLIQLGKREMNARAYVSRFNFSGSDQQKRVGQLSGGEQTESIWPKCSNRARTFCCSMSPPTIWMSTQCVRSKRRWRISAVAPL